MMMIDSQLRRQEGASVYEVLLRCNWQCTYSGASRKR